MNGAIIREESREIATLRAVWVNVLAVVRLVVDPLAIGVSTVLQGCSYRGGGVEKEVEGGGEGNGRGWVAFVAIGGCEMFLRFVGHVGWGSGG